MTRKTEEKLSLLEFKEGKSGSNEDEMYPCTLCMKIHTWITICNEQLPVELFHQLVQERLIENRMDGRHEH